MSSSLILGTILRGGLEVVPALSHKQDDASSSLAPATIKSSKESQLLRKLAHLVEQLSYKQ